MPSGWKRRSRRAHDHESSEMGFRSLEIRSASLNKEERSIEADVSTENPVAMPDFARGEMVPEILVTSGAILPKSRQVPFLDSHQRASVANQLGSARGLEIKDDKLVSRLHFSSAAEGEFTKVREGHVTDVSAGYQVLKKTYIPRGETKEIKGRSYSGPANVVTSWRLMEVSLTPIGADSMAKLRGLDPLTVRFLSPENESEFTMNPKLRALCVSRGMDEKLNDEEAEAWLVRELPAFLKDKEDEESDDEKAKKKKMGDEEKDSAKSFAEEVSNRIAENVRIAFAAEQKRIAEFNADVLGLCQLADLPGECEACRALPDLAAVRKHLADAKAKAAEKIPYSINIRQTGSGLERLVADMGTALTMRAMQSASTNSKVHDVVFPVEKRGKGAETFRYASPFQMAEEYVRGVGIDTRGLTREQVAICAMFGPEAAGLGRRDAAYHTTGSFTNLTLDAMNKSMMVGYTEAPSTWRGPMRQAASAPDFKEIHRIRMGAIPNLPVWNDNKPPESASFADAREHYAVEARSLEISYSYRLLVNDDMDVLSRTPAMMGMAAARTVNAVAWAQYTSNPTLSDGVALFAVATGARKRTNLTSGAGAPSVSTLQTLSNLMRQMRGENTPEGNESADILNLSPRYIIGPSALDTTIKQLVLSAYDPAANSFQVYNTASQLVPVIEPLLDVASTTAWYLSAEPNQIDTVELSFLQGQESPITRSFLDEKTLAQSVTILQTFAAKAMNHRGVQKHAGA